MVHKSQSPLPNPREAVILAVLARGEKYARQICEQYNRRTGHDMPLGSLYTTLDRMADKGLIASRHARPPGRKTLQTRRYCRLTARGRNALKQISAWTGSLRPRAR
jgi:DNA-binding PadR family transcriptional regulator